MSQMTAILSGAASLGVLAGIVSGIFYLVLTGLRWAGRLRAALQEEEARRQNGIPTTGTCVICGRAPDPLKEGLDPVGCSDCGGNACKGDGCSRRSSVGWRCVLCHVKRDLKKTSGNWFNQKTNPDAIEPAENEKNVDSETIQVREFIEKLVEVIVGGPLDRVTVGKLSTHSAYKHGCDFDSPSSAHAALKHLIEKIVNEAMTLPNLKEALYSSSNEIVNEEEDFTNKSYEDILATAILNKVIEKFQQQNGRRYETIDKNSNLVTDSNCGGSGKSGSAHDDDLQSNSDWSDTSRTEPLSLTIEEHIEEVTTTYESSDEDERRDITQVDTELKVNRRVPFPESGRVILDGSDEEENSDSDEVHSSVTELVTSPNSWEENWLFQKKRLRSTPSAHHPVPVPMLVPNPSQEFRALIGGVDADDLSDMSECSDSVLEDVVLADNDVDDPDLSKQIVDALNDDTESSQNELNNSKSEQKIVENHHENENPKEQISDSQAVEEKKEVESEEISSSKINGYADTDEEIMNGETTPPDSLNSESSPQSLSQKDRECSVDYEIVHQIDVPVPKIPVPKPRTLDLINNEKPVSEKPPKCPIAEREKEKWKHAIELPNNPYSPENIAKRIQSRQNNYFRSGFGSLEAIDFPDDIKEDSLKDETDSPRYSRDYYVKASRSPTGDPSVRSSSSISQLSESSEEVSSPVRENGKSDSENSEIKESIPIELKPDYVPEMKPHKEVRVLVRSHAVDKTDVVLPSVKELAKQFVQNDTKPPQPKQRWKSLDKTSQDMSKGDFSCKRSESSSNNSIGSASDARELEVDYSLVPVSEIISNLLKNSSLENSKKENNNNNNQINQIKENGVSKPEVRASEPIIHMVRFNGKQVHSLTARSISKEFREGLKKNTTYNRLVKIDRGSSGESDHGEIYSAAENNRPPTPPIDLKSKKKFWEDIINSNSSK